MHVSPPLRILCPAILAGAFAVGNLTVSAQQPAPQTPAPQTQPQPAPEPSQPQPAPSQPSAPQPDQQQPAPAQPSTPQPDQQQAPAAAQQPAPEAPAPAQAQPAPSAPATSPTPSTATSEESGITEDELRQELQGKTFYLRGGYLDNSLHFNYLGVLEENSPQASYTLSLVQIDRVHLDKKHIELEGVRYGLHFLGALAYEDQASAVDKVRLTSKKKPLKITIDREEVVKPKKEKEPAKPIKVTATGTTIIPAHPAAGQPQAPAAAPVASAPAQPQPQPEVDRRGFGVTSSQTEADRQLQKAVGRILSPGIDDLMVSTLPDYWKRFYQSVAAKQDYRPSDPGVYRQGQVDRKARLVSAFEPPSNEYAQNNGVAGMAMYHVVVEPDGKAGEIAVARPIGFGLDENAVAAIRQASFEPAMKDGKPVPVTLDLVIQFRIFSKRTSVASNKPIAAPGQTPAPQLPGPYTANEPRPPAPQPAQPADQSTQQPAQQPPDQPAQPPAAAPQSTQQPAPQPSPQPQ